MAVEARHLNLFPSHLVANREMRISYGNEANQQTLFNNASLGYAAPPLSGITTETLHPMYNSAIADSLPPVTSDSGLTYNHLSVSRKRSRDSSVNPMLSFPGCSFPTNNGCGSFTFLGEDISLQIQQQQLEIEHFISQHTEKLKIEIEERRKRYATRIFAAVEQGIMKKLKSKEEEIDKFGKLNWALEEKVKSLCIENQIWRDLAHANEATANTLRTNLEHVLSEFRNQQLQHQQNRRHHGAGTVEDDAVLDDAQSCCGSNGMAGDDDERRTVAVASSSSSIGDRMCRNCGRDESSVLLLPCRHLCLCNVCGSSVHTCPICKSTKNASVHINLSS